MKFIGEVNYYSELPSGDAVAVGDCWRVKFSGSSGAVTNEKTYAWLEVSGTEQWVEVPTDDPAYLPRPASGIAAGKIFRVDSYDEQTGALELETEDIPGAVKSAMSSATDPAWTDAERLAALARMGCVPD